MFAQQARLVSGSRGGFRRVIYVDAEGTQVDPPLVDSATLLAELQAASVPEALQRLLRRQRRRRRGSGVPRRWLARARRRLDRRHHARPARAARLPDRRAAGGGAGGGAASTRPSAALRLTPTAPWCQDHRGATSLATGARRPAAAHRRRHVARSRLGADRAAQRRHAAVGAQRRASRPGAPSTRATRRTSAVRCGATSGLTPPAARGAAAGLSRHGDDPLAAYAAALAAPGRLPAPARRSTRRRASRCCRSAGRPGAADARHLRCGARRRPPSSVPRRSGRRSSTRALAAIISTDAQGRIVEVQPRRRRDVRRRAEVLDRSVMETIVPAAPQARTRRRSARFCRRAARRRRWGAAPDDRDARRRARVPAEVVIWRTDLQGEVALHRPRSPICPSGAPRPSRSSASARRCARARSSGRHGQPAGRRGARAEQPAGHRDGRASLLEEKCEARRCARRARIREAAERCGASCAPSSTWRAPASGAAAQRAAERLARAAADMLAVHLRSHGIELQLELAPACLRSAPMPTRSASGAQPAGQRAAGAGSSAEAAGPRCTVHRRGGAPTTASRASGCAWPTTARGVPPALHETVFEPFFTTSPRASAPGWAGGLARRWCASTAASSGSRSAPAARVPHEPADQRPGASSPSRGAGRLRQQRPGARAGGRRRGRDRRTDADAMLEPARFRGGHRRIGRGGA